MQIRPFDINATLSRSQDVTQIKHQEEIKPSVDQSHFQNTFQKEVEHNLRSVTPSEKGEKEETKYDAKEKGQGQQYTKEQEKKKHQEKQTEKEKIKMHQGFDIRI